MTLPIKYEQYIDKIPKIIISTIKNLFSSVHQPVSLINLVPMKQLNGHFSQPIVAESSRPLKLK